MEPVMKVVDSQGQTVYLFNLYDVVAIWDTSKGTTLVLEGEVDPGILIYIPNVRARIIKRSIQENVDEPIGFLKTDIEGDKGHLRYDNVRYIRAIHPQKGPANEKWAVINNEWVIHAEPQPVAAQVRRVLKRLDQDEEFCCAAQEGEE